MMRELSGWPVRHAQGGANIAYFTSSEAADAAVRASEREYRAVFGVPYYEPVP